MSTERKLKTIKNRAKRATTGAAGVAFATSGLSSCNDNGAVDPLPPPLQCNSVNAGQTMFPSIAQDGDTLVVSLENRAFNATWSDSLAVIDPIGVRVLNVRVPPPLSVDPVVISLQPDPPTVSTASFTVVGEMRGFDDSRCAFSRTFEIELGAAGVTISLRPNTQLPLQARQRAEIVITQRNERTLYLEAQSPYKGDTTFEWEVTGGELVSDGHSARWQLPDRPGLYQIELVMDYGIDGLAFDSLTLEVA